jgi:hypothetical protein
MSVFGGSQIDKPLPSSSTHPRQTLLLSPWTVSTSSAEAMIKRSQSGQYQRTPIQRRVSIFDSCTTIRLSFVQILAIMTAYDACLTEDLSTAEELLTQEIHTDPNNYTSYAHRSFIMSRKHAWDLALEDAIKVSYTDPSWPSYSILAFIHDIVHQHSVLTDRLYLQGHRPLRKRPRPGGKDSI